MAFICYEGAKEKNGKMYLRFDDTNPELARQEYVDQFKRDLNWLGIGWDAESYTSDFMELFYEYGIKMVEIGSAYVCECSPETIKINRRERRECPKIHQAGIASRDETNRNN